MQATFILAGLAGLLLLRVPVAFALAAVGVILLWLKGLPLIMVSQFMLSGVNSFELLAVPLFLLMAHVLLLGGVGADLFRAVQAWIGHWPGGLGVATVATCALFATISGSSIATAATVGSVAILEMTSRGYPRHFTIGLVAAGGTLGILIPPSIPMIVYAMITDSSITALFLAGVGPGLALLGMFILYCFWFASTNKDWVPAARVKFAERLDATWGVLPVAFIGVVVLGGIYGGAFTPTEAAGVGFVLSLATVAAKGRASADGLRRAALAAAVTTISVLLIVAGAKLFGRAITIYQIPQEISSAVLVAFNEPWAFVAVICLVLLLMGLFLESMSMILIMMPILIGSLAPMGLHPVWFGVVFVIMIECALITPPIGMNLFVVQAVGRARISEVVRGVWPFVVMMLAMTQILWFFPGLAMWLPYR